MTLLELLDNGMLHDPSIDDYPDAGQAAMKRRLLAEIQHLADEGVPARDYDYLTDGIWELKIETLRVTFYDTPGGGERSPKSGCRNQNHWAGRRREFPEQGMDEFVRLGHYFVKTGPKTSKHDIEDAIRVRKEDLDYDRN